MKMTKNIMIFQAPYASLQDCGFLLELHKDNSEAPVPAQYYSPVFSDSVELPDNCESLNAVLEYIFSLFNRDGRPNGKTMRSLSIGDVIRMDNKYYLVQRFGFKEIEFKSTDEENLDFPKPDSKAGYVDYLKGKYGIRGKAAILMDNIFKYMSEQGMDFEEEQEFLEAMLFGLGISTDDRELLHVLTALQDVLDYIQFEADTTDAWPFGVSDDEMLADQERLLQVAARLAETDNLGSQYSSDCVYEELLKEFGESHMAEDGEEGSITHRL